MIVAVVNQKGGVGKTTVALGLADAAARDGLRVLLVDLDPQANATSGLAVWDPPATVDRALEADRAGGLAEVVVPAGWPAPVTGGGVDVAPSSPTLAAREPLLAMDPVGAQDRLRIALAGDDHDLVLVDCPPSLGLLTVNGLFAADRALVVTEPAAWASDGVEQVVRTIGRVGDRRGRPLPLAGVVANRVGRTRDARYWLGQLAEGHGDHLLGPVTQRAAVAEAAAQSLPLSALGTRPGAAEALAELDDVLAGVLGLPRSAPAVERCSAGAQAFDGDGDGDGEPGGPVVLHGQPLLDPSRLEPPVLHHAVAPGAPGAAAQTPTPWPWAVPLSQGRPGER